MRSALGDLYNIARYGLIKIGPGLFNLLLIPYLVAVLGAGAYGSYSLWLGYAMLAATVLSEVSQAYCAVFEPKTRVGNVLAMTAPLISHAMSDIRDGHVS